MEAQGFYPSHSPTFLTLEKWDEETIEPFCPFQLSSVIALTLAWALSSPQL